MANSGIFFGDVLATNPLTEQLVRFQRITISLQELDTTITYGFLATYWPSSRHRNPVNRINSAQHNRFSG